MTRLSLRRKVAHVLLFVSLAPFVSTAASDRLLSALDESGDIAGLAAVPTIPSGLIDVRGFKPLGSELRALRSRFGSTPVVRLSSREGSPFAMCYAADGGFVIFRAGAMGGWKHVTGVTVLRVASLIPMQLSCAPSDTLAAWMRISGTNMMNGSHLSRSLGMASLPANGVLTTKQLKIAGKEHVVTTAVVYDHEPPLNWVDISHWVER